MLTKSKDQVTKAGALVSFTFLLLLTSAQGLAQSMEFSPDFNGTVTDIVIQADGKILVAGDFSRVNEVSRSGLARLKNDGSLDGNFNPQPNVVVRSIATLANGQMGKSSLAVHSPPSAASVALFETGLPKSTLMARSMLAITPT